MKIHLFDNQYVKRKSPINLKNGDEKLFQNALPGYLIKSSHLLILKNVFVFFDVPYKTGVLYLSYAFLHPPKWIDLLKRLRLIFYLNSINIPKAIWIIDNWSSGYFHWMTDALPRLIASTNYISGHKVLLPEQYDQYSYISDSLKILGFEPIYYDIKKKVKVVDFLLTSHTSQTGNYNETLLWQLKLKLLANVTPTINHKRIYISRKKASFRFIKNEEEVIKILENNGFEIHCFEDYSLNQQMEIMSQTKYLVSLHGAGLTNMLFMKENGSVLELRNERDISNNCYFSLSASLKLNYYYLLCQTTPGSTQFADFEINISLLTEELTKMIYE